DDSFRIRSYRMAAESVESCGPDIGEILTRGEALPRLPGVGKGIEAKVRELVESGGCAFHRELLAEVPAGLLDLLRIPGLGPRAALVYLAELASRRFAPRSRAYARWTRGFQAVGKFWTGIILSVVYFVSVAGVSVVMKLLGRDPLDRTLERQPTWWRPHDPNP